nr:hypothetical protein [Nocardia sp. SYP-A9097]
MPQVSGQWAGEPDLGVGGDDSQVQRSAASGVRSLGRVQSREVIVVTVGHGHDRGSAKRNSGDQPLDHAAQLGGGHQGGVVRGSESPRVQDLSPRRGP